MSPIILKIIIDALSSIFVIIMGLLSYRYMSPFLKLLFYLTALYLLTLVGAYLITEYSDDNQWFYNIYIVIEFCALIYSFHLIYQNNSLRSILFFLLALFISAYILQISLCGFYELANYAYAMGCLIITALFSLVLYRLYQTEANNWLRSPEICACLGIILYFSCNVPHMSLLHYLGKHYPGISEIAFRVINDVLSNFRYLFLAYALLLVYRRKNKLPITL